MDYFENKIKEIGEFSEGLAPFKNYNDKWGFINLEGVVVIKPMYYDVLSGFKNGTAAVNKGSKHYPECFLIDKNNKKVSKTYSYIDKFYNGIAVVKKINPGLKVTCGHINRKGKEEVPCKFKHANPFKSNYCNVIDFTGKSHVFIPKYKEEDTIDISYTKSANNTAIIDKLTQKYKYVEEIDGYYIVSNRESFDDVYGGMALGLANSRCEEIFPLGAYDIKKVGKDLFFINQISRYILFNAKKVDMDNLKPANFSYEVRYGVKSTMVRELSKPNDFVLIVKRNLDSLTDNYYLVKKEYLKNKIIVSNFDVFVVDKTGCHIYDDIKSILPYLDLSKLSFDGVDITNTDFFGSNAKINPQTVFNKDLSGVRISATNIINDQELLEPNYGGVITDSNTEIIGEYLDYKGENKLIRKL